LKKAKGATQILMKTNQIKILVESFEKTKTLALPP
jgi:hypothetical protein